MTELLETILERVKGDKRLKSLSLYKSPTKTLEGNGIYPYIKIRDGRDIGGIVITEKSIVVISHGPGLELHEVIPLEDPKLFEKTIVQIARFKKYNHKADWEWQ